MRNLKRALSLILAAAMLIGMMVVGAGAVSYNDFPDRDEIVNKDAVSMLTTLGIIEGTDQGTYNPTGNVDRAQMAKMISVALTNNENCDTLYMNVDSGLTDIAANWARGYINYCYTLGIIAGRGNNTFDPSANVTGVEAAKMLLTALGYDAEIEGLVGTDWALNTAALAQNLGIFRNFTKDVSEPLNRDDAALLIYNALDVELIQEYRNGYAISYDDHRTILSSVFGVIRVEGVVIGNEWAQLEETDSDAALQEGRTRLENVVWYDSTTANTVVDEGVRVTEPVTFNVSTPVDYMGKAVTLYVEKTTILSNSKVIGVATNDDMNTIVSSAANQSTAKDLLDGTGVTVSDSTEYYVNYGYETRSNATKLVNNWDWTKDGTKFDLNGVEVEVIDNDDDGTAEYVLYTRETLSNVVRTSSRDETTTINVPIVNSSDILTTVAGSSTTTEVLDNEDIVTEMELAAEDLILYVQYGGRTYITAPEIVTDTMTRVDRDRNNEQYITLSNGDTYRMSYIRETLSRVDADVTRFEFNNNATSADFDVNYEWILDSNGYIVDFRPADELVRNYGLVLDSAWTQNALSRSGEIKILDTSGIEHTYTINWNASRDVFDYDGKQKGSDLDIALEDYLGTRDVNDPGITNVYDLGAAKGSVIEYTLNEAGDRLTITNVLDQNTLGTDNGLADSTAADKEDITVDVSKGLSSIVYMEDKANTTIDDRNLQYTLTQDYKTGGGNLYVEYNVGTTTQAKTFAVDRNTIAFYYDVVEATDLGPNGRYYGSNYSAGDVLYGVATGWDEMGDVKNAANQDAKVQVYPVITKQGGNYTASNLADVVLFNYELTTDTADWMLVLNANAVNSSTLELNVVFEDGTAAAIEVDRDDYDDTFYNNSTAYMKAYKYSVNANGEYTINTNSAVSDTPASLLRDGTVDTNTGYQYLTITGDSKVWDVTDVDSAEDEVVAGSFDYANPKHAVIIPTDSNRTIKTAWVWDMDGDTVTGSNCTFDWTLTNYETVWAPTGTTGNWVDYMVWTQIRDAFAAGKNVMIFGNANLAYNIDIPAGLILQVEGDLRTSGSGNVTGNGTLRVHGTFHANTDIRVATYAEDLIAANNIGIYANTHVQDQADLGTSDASDGVITIGTGVHLCARNADNIGNAINVRDDVDNYGHVETTGNIYYAAAFRDLSANSMIINGNMVFGSNGSLTVGSGTAYTGNVTVLGGTVTAASGATGVSLYVDNGTVALGTGSSIDLRAGTNTVLTVDNGGRITQTYSYNAQNVMADTINITDGDVAIYGDLVASNRLTISGPDAEVSARNINAMVNGSVVIDETVRPGNVTGTIAKGATPVPGTDGSLIYGGNYDTTIAESENWLTAVTVGGLSANLDAETRTGAVTLVNGTQTVNVTYKLAADAKTTAVTLRVGNAADGTTSTNGTFTNVTIPAAGTTLYLTMTVAGETQTYAVTVTVAETSYVVTTSSAQNVTITPTNTQAVSGANRIVAGTDLLFTVKPNDGYAIDTDTVTYQVGNEEPVAAQYVSTDDKGVATYRVPGTAVTGNITLNATVKAIVNDATLTLKVSDDYKVDVDTTATLVAEITNQNGSNVEVLVSSLPRDLAEVGYVLEIDSTRDASEGVANISFSGYSVNEDGTSATVTVTTAPAQGYNKVTKTVTFTVADAETKVTKDVAVIREWINGYVFDLTTNKNYAEIVKQAIVDQFDDGVWGSTVEVGNVSLDGDIQSGMALTSVKATLNITVSIDKEASASIGTMTIKVSTN